MYDKLLPHFLLKLAFPAIVLAITTIHHDKPEEAGISQMATQMQQAPINASTPVSDRQKRLLPYINYYLDHRQKNNNNFNDYPQQLNQHTEKFTPFLDSNALPGPFVPILNYGQKTKQVAYSPQPPTPEENGPNYSEIYDKLAHLSQQINKPPYQQSYNTNPAFRKQQIKYVPVHHYEQEQYKNIQPPRTVIRTYTPTNIDIQDNDKSYESIRAPVKNHNNENLIYKIFTQKPQYITFPLQQNYQTESNDIAITSPKPYFVQNEIQRNPVIYTFRTKPKQVNTITDDRFVAQKFVTSVPNHENINVKPFTPVQFVPEQYQVKDEGQDYYYQTPAPVTQQIPTESTSSLSHILKQLQESNTLPQTLTSENIDNSIKTLVKILNTLKKQQKLIAKPIVVADEISDEVVDLGDDVIEEPEHEYVPGTVSQNFPADTVEGGTPGRPGIDYPALSSIPPTTFNCKTQRYKGFFGDPNTNCQVWHYCDLNGGQASFLCPNGTIFSQVALTCDWWYNVKCSSTAQLYVLNERLYKYILPLSPKFPEDYSGPLVDKYIALKFKEMEEKMKKEKKEEKSEEEKDDSDQLQELQDIQNEKNAQSAEET